MKCVLGLGSAGVGVVTHLEKHKQYRVYKISTKLEENNKRSFKLPVLKTAEQYEEMDTSKINKILETVKGTLSVFVSGASMSSNLSLRIMEPLHRRGIKLDVIYIKPETDLLSHERTLQERTVRSVLQQYSRSAVFEKMILCDNSRIEEHIGPTNVFNHYDKINETISNTYYMLDVFKNSKPVLSTFSPTQNTNRISTVGVSSVAGPDSLFYPLHDERELFYYFGINEDKLKAEDGLFKEITTRIRQETKGSRKASFAIYPTQYDDNYIYVEYFSPSIQN